MFLDYLMKTVDFLRQHSPDFCWCTAWDLFRMHEEENWDCEYDVFKVTLSQIQTREQIFKVKQGIRQDTPFATGKPPRLYLRVK